MTTSYAIRLVCISSAAFFLMHSVLALLVHMMAGPLARLAGTMPSRRAAEVMFWARLAPALVALFLVAAVCVPSFLWLEQEAGEEAVGVLALTAAAMGAALWCVSIGRTLAAGFRSVRYMQCCERAGSAGTVDRELPVLVTDAPGGLMLLAGVFRPVLVVSRAVLGILAPAQLEAAISHERAHAASRDNFRRLLMLLAPGVFPFFRGFASVEAAWSRFAEWAADDRAAAGDARRSLALAEALIGVARLEKSGPPLLLAAPLMTEAEEIGARVGRLLQPQLPAEAAVRPDRLLQVCAVFLFLAGLGAMLVRPGTMQAAHEALEQMIR